MGSRGGELCGLHPCPCIPQLRTGTPVPSQTPRSPLRPNDDGESWTWRRKQVPQPGVTQKEQIFCGEGNSDPHLRSPTRTSSIPSMWDSISCTIRAFLSTSSALFMPLLILSATCLMLRWASMRKGWSGWSSGVCFSRSCHGDRAGLSPLPAPGHQQCHCPSPSQAAVAAGDGSSPKEGGTCPAERLRVRGLQQGDCPQSDHLQEGRAMCTPGDTNFVTGGGKRGQETPESPESCMEARRSRGLPLCWCDTCHPGVTHLHQQLVSRDPLHRLDHQVGQGLLLLVLPHALLQNTHEGQGWAPQWDTAGAQPPTNPAAPIFVWGSLPSTPSGAILVHPN